MSDNKRSFWSSIPGLITGLAGLLTGIVGLITLLVQQGIIGHDSGSKSPPANSSTTVAAGTAATTSSSVSGTTGTTPTSEVATFSVTPQAVDFPATDQSPKTVTVRNTSTSAKLNVQPQIQNGDSDRFSVVPSGCSSLPANGTCTLKVTFTPQSGAALKKYSATLRVGTAETARVTEVTLTASTLL